MAWRGVREILRGTFLARVGGMQVLRSALGALFLLGISGCFAAVGPTVGVDLATGRATLGVEASAATFTVAHSVALGSGAPLPSSAPPSGSTPPSASVPPASDYWRSRTYLLWEPALGIPISDINQAFGWISGGGSLGVRWESYDDAATRAHFTAGNWFAVGATLTGPQSSDCGASDTRPYVALVVGMRGGELYASPKVGVLQVPKICLFGPNDHLFEGDF